MPQSAANELEPHWRKLLVAGSAVALASSIAYVARQECPGATLVALAPTYTALAFSVLLSLGAIHGSCFIRWDTLSSVR